MHNNLTIQYRNKLPLKTIHSQPAQNCSINDPSPDCIFLLHQKYFFILHFLYFHSRHSNCHHDGMKWPLTNNEKYDIEKGLLLKLDSFLQIQLGTVYRGLTRVPDDEVLKLYRNRIIPVKYVEGNKHSVSHHSLILLCL